MTPLLSIVTISFNDEHGLALTLDSVYNFCASNSSYLFQLVIIEKPLPTLNVISNAIILHLIWRSILINKLTQVFILPLTRLCTLFQVHG